MIDGKALSKNFMDRLRLQYESGGINAIVPKIIVTPAELDAIQRRFSYTDEPNTNINYFSAEFGFGTDIVSLPKIYLEVVD